MFWKGYKMVGISALLCDHLVLGFLLSQLAISPADRLVDLSTAFPRASNSTTSNMDSLFSREFPTNCDTGWWLIYKCNSMENLKNTKSTSNIVLCSCVMYLSTLFLVICLSWETASIPLTVGSNHLLTASVSGRMTGIRSCSQSSRPAESLNNRYQNINVKNRTKTTSDTY